MTQYKKKKFAALPSAPMAETGKRSNSVIRAAVDIGSGAVKLTVAEVDTHANQIVQVLYQCANSLELGKHFAANPEQYLPNVIQLELRKMLRHMLGKANEFKPQQWLGVGTSVFRKARNGLQLLDELKAEFNLTIRLISQTEEAEIGFLSGVAASNLSSSEVKVWDSGSGSFQMTAMTDGLLLMYGAEYGFVPVLETLFANRRDSFSHDLSPNPISLEEALMLVQSIHQNLPEVPEWLLDEKKQMIAIGGELSIFSFARVAFGRTTFSKAQVWEAVVKLCGSQDAELAAFPIPKDAVVKIILLYALMHHCGMDILTYYPTNGACEGLLISPQYWQDTPSTFIRF